jgi:hypothetical protein
MLQTVFEPSDKSNSKMYNYVTQNTWLVHLLMCLIAETYDTQEILYRLTHLHLVPRSKNEWSYIYTPPIRLHGVVLS